MQSRQAPFTLVGKCPLHSLEVVGCADGFTSLVLFPSSSMLVLMCFFLLRISLVTWYQDGQHDSIFTRNVYTFCSFVGNVVSLQTEFSGRTERCSHAH